MKIGFVGPSYTARSTVIADQECINLFAETIEAPSATGEQGLRGYFAVPGLVTFATLPESPTRGSCTINGRTFAVGGTKFCEINADGTNTIRGTVANDSLPVSYAVSNIQVLIVAAGKAYCFTLATNALQEVTSSLAGVPMQAEYSDGYFIVAMKNSNKFQMSGILDGLTWPGIQVNAVEVFPENIISIVVNHRELWVFGGRHIQPYYDSGSDEIFDVIGGSLIEKGCAATFATCRVDNTVFWIDEDERGSRSAWRAQGYTPQRISTHAVETDLATYSSISGLTSYAYEDAGHLFWVLYVPGSQWSWVYDVAESLWHKRASWNTGSATWGAHPSWNHVNAFGKHLVGDWASGKLYDQNLNYLDYAGAVKRWLRRAPNISNEMQWISGADLVIDLETGLGPQPPFTDGDGNDRPPQVMLRWSDDYGKTWSNGRILDCGLAGEFRVRVIARRIGRWRNRIFELSGTDPIAWAIRDAYLRLRGGNGT
jgi:hypothetical protein